MDDIPFISINRNSNTALTRQVFESISRNILSGSLRGGERLPSSRALADQLGVSRNVIVEALEQLTSEGFLETRKGSGTYVATGIHISPAEAECPVEFEKVGFEELRTDIVDFRSGLPDMNFFPRSIWIQLTKEIYSNSTFDSLSYHHPEGAQSLRKEIASYICSRRGGRCTEQQIVITSGTTQAISLVSRLLLGKTKHLVWLEDPITNDIQSIIRNNGGTLVGMNVEQNGMAVPAARPGGAFIYTTPSHQFPLGITMTVQKRSALLEFARKQDCYIVEDDYDSEFRFDGQPLSCMQGLDPDRVIYIGTFSKTLCPAFRIGYLILPNRLVNTGRRQKWFTDLHSPIPNQLVLAEFIRRGHYTRHITRMRKIYRERRIFLEQMLVSLFGSDAHILGSRTGIHMCVKFPGMNFDEKMLKILETAGCKVYPVSRHAVGKNLFTDSIILGYGCIEKAGIERGIKKLYGVWENCVHGKDDSDS
ncbi:MAG: PLP-dependent aminotransferase family protein [Spirochaetales bacterium]|nr:PLP-dependent aminotransferase family protein [Spirochaetales bacterium]